MPLEAHVPLVRRAAVGIPSFTSYGPGLGLWGILYRVLARVLARVGPGLG